MSTRSRRFETARRGRTNSQDINDFMDLVVRDIDQLDTTVTSNTNQVEKDMQILSAEIREMREEVERLKKKYEVENDIAKEDQTELFYMQDFRRTANVTYGSGTAAIPDGKKLRVDTEYGQLILPYNNLYERLFYKDIDTGEVRTYSGVTLSVTATSESGNSAVVSGTPANAVNGINESYWLREVKYEPHSDVSEVECQLRVEIPSSRIMKSNMLVLHPYPAGLVDIVDVEYTTDGSESWTSFNSSASDTLYPSCTFPMTSAGLTRLVFPALEITKLRITLKQRNHTMRNGYKSFQYGLQEVSLRLIDYETYGASNLFDGTANPNPNDVNSVITKIDAPSGYTFLNLTGFWTAPGYSASGGGVGGTGSYGWPVYHRIYTDSDLTNKVWDSYSDSIPQDSAVNVSAQSASSIYVITSCGYDTSKAVPPVVDYWALKYTVES